MKQIYLTFILLISISSAFADSWVQKHSLVNAIVRATGFSIGDRGYIGTGEVSGTPTQDFWKYDSGADSWTQMASFSGAPRMDAVGFSIGANGYIGTGWNGTILYQDFYKYDTTSNSWTQISSFPGGLRQSAVAFSIGSKGYVGTGVDAVFTFYADFWEYDPLSGWSSKAAYPVTAAKGTGVGIGAYGYMGAGEDDNGNLNSFYKYDPALNAWSPKASIPGTAREGATGFSIDGYIYIGTGFNGVNTKDFWQYDTTANNWTQKTNLTGAARSNAAGFSIGSNGYIGSGTPGLSDFWEYIPDLPTGMSNSSALNNFDVYPNPATNKLYINVKSLATTRTLAEIYNVLGNQIYSSQSEDFISQHPIAIDISSYAKGVYFIFLNDNSAIEDKNSARSWKFIKE